MDDKKQDDTTKVIYNREHIEEQQRLQLQQQHAGLALQIDESLAPREAVEGYNPEFM